MAATGQDPREYEAQRSATADTIRRAAENAADDALHRMAVAIAIERNRFGPNAGTKYLQAASNGERVIDHTHYPGDDIYHRAREELAEVIGR